MSRLAIIENKEPGRIDAYKLSLDGNIINLSTARKHIDGSISGRIFDYSAVAELMCGSFSELIKVNILTLTCDFSEDEIEFIDYFCICLSGIKQRKQARLKFEWNIEPGNWVFPWTISEYADELQKRIQSRGDSRIEYYKGKLGAFEEGFGIIFEVRDIDNIIEEELNYWVGELRLILEEVMIFLMSRVSPNTLVTLFDFPDNVKTICEQYLLYFIQFLRDLGIAAQADIKHSSHGVLFSVTPMDNKQALNGVREALEIYLRIG